MTRLNVRPRPSGCDATSRGPVTDTCERTSGPFAKQPAKLVRFLDSANMPCAPRMTYIRDTPERLLTD